jgi:hypothetical protein
MILLISSSETRNEVLISSSSDILTEETRKRAVRAFNNSYNSVVGPESLTVIDFLETKGRKTKWHKCFAL